MLSLPCFWTCPTRFDVYDSDAYTPAHFLLLARAGNGSYSHAQALGAPVSIPLPGRPWRWGMEENAKNLESVANFYNQVEYLESQQASRLREKRVLQQTKEQSYVFVYCGFFNPAHLFALFMLQVL